MKPQSPINALPPLVVGLALLIVGVEVVLQLANYGIIGGPRGVGWRISAIEQYGFSSGVLDRVLVNNDYSFDMLKRFVTYPFINGQLTQVAFCAALTLALGKFTAEYYGAIKVGVIYVVTSIVGAVVFGLLVETRFPLIGGFTPVLRPYWCLYLRSLVAVGRCWRKPDCSISLDRFLAVDPTDIWIDFWREQPMDCRAYRVCVRFCVVCRTGAGRVEQFAAPHAPAILTAQVSPEFR